MPNLRPNKAKIEKGVIMNKPIDVLGIVEKWLVDNGFDGLYEPEGECALWFSYVFNSLCFGFSGRCQF